MNDDEIIKARAAFVALAKERNAQLRRPVPLKKAWRGHGFQDWNTNKWWEQFLQGWMAHVRLENKPPASS